MSKLLSRTQPKRLRLGIYGGTFDPIHLGHLILAADAREQLQLDAVLFTPCSQSPHKLQRQAAGAKDRLAMLRRALRGHANFWLSRIEIDRTGPSYAIDTVREIQTAFPGADLYWLIGSDQLPKLATWKEYPSLLKEITFAVLERGGSSRRLPRGVIRLPQSRRVDISASEIRERTKKGLPINHLVPAPVASYIQRTHLYH